ncbi:MAG: VanZ family protein [Bacilli bacterium]|nr:VanZ family protein [Bacilli bacterium]
MKLKNQDKFNKIISLIFLIIWLLLIFYFSNQQGSVSENSSNTIINLLDKIFKLFNQNIDITSLNYIAFLVRKSAHMFLYFILYLLTYYAMYEFNIKKRIYLSLIFCFLYAISDEIHQLFIPRRSFQITDILIDTIGASIAFIPIILKNKFRKTCKI